MIKINEKVKSGEKINHLNCPRLFAKDDRTGEYYKVRDFAWDYDDNGNYDLIIETTITDASILKARIIATLAIRKQLVLEGIKLFKKELKKINNLLIEQTKGENKNENN